MKLHTEELTALHHRGKSSAVLALAHGGLDHWCPVGVSEIHKRVLREAAHQARSAANLQLVPSHVRRFHRGRKLLAFAREQPQAAQLRRFPARLKHPRHAQTNTEQRNLPLDRSHYRFLQSTRKNSRGLEISYAR